MVGGSRKSVHVEGIHLAALAAALPKPATPAGDSEPTVPLAFAVKEDIEVDTASNHSDADSINGRRFSNIEIPSRTASTRSARESIFDFIKENGRTYHSHAAGSYFLPNDQAESERMDLMYFLFRVILGQKDFVAPVTKPSRILDIGCGNGTWAIAVGEQFPNAEVIGVDLSPIQPEWTPPNVKFIIDDASLLDFGGTQLNSYSLIHTSMLLGSFEDFRTIINRSFDYLEPGGWMESLEAYPKAYTDDDSIEEGNKFVEWTSLFDECAMKSLRPIRTGNKLKKWYTEAGFIDVQELVLKLPIGPWPRDPQFKLIGRFWQKSVVDGLQGFSLAFFSRVFGWTKEEIEVYLSEVRKSVLNKKCHMYHKMYVVWGRKPGTLDRERSPTPTPPGTASTVTS